MCNNVQFVLENGAFITKLHSTLFLQPKYIYTETAVSDMLDTNTYMYSKITTGTPEAI